MVEPVVEPMAEEVVDHEKVEVVTRGPVGPADVAYARRRVAALLDLDRAPMSARVVLTRAGDPARERPAIAEGQLEVHNQIVRAHVAGRDMREASDLLQSRLRDRLEHVSEKQRWRRHQGTAAEPGTWRHGDRVASRPEWFDRPLDERELVRTKSYAIGAMTAEDAAFDIESLDHDFLLFVDVATGEDAVIERADGSYRVTSLHPTGTGTHPPTLSLADAIERLGASGERWLFFADATSGRGNVLYQRFDGHYGLVEPT
jgi:ribosome-associated translation inhibitor RaiA